MILYYHPLSSCSWKVLIALYENGTAFEPRTLDDAAAAQSWLALWPLGKFPVLRDEARDRTIAETSIIVEYLGQHHPGPFRPIPQEADAALEVRLMDRLFDIYVMTPMQAIVADKIRPEGVAHDTHGVGKRGGCWTRPMPCWRTGWRGGDGRRGTTSPSPTARRRLRSSMRTGSSPCGAAFPDCAPISNGWRRGKALRGCCAKRNHGGTCSPLPIRDCQATGNDRWSGSHGKQGIQRIGAVSLRLPRP